jgi:GT2 family glycosyltransferase
MTTLYSIIIPVYRRTAWIGQCIEALKNQQAGACFELIVVDDGSPNVDEIEMLVRAAFDTLLIPCHFIRTSNGGPAKARNTGVRHATGTVLCFLDDDSVPDQDWLSEIKHSFDEDTEVAVVSGPALSHDRCNALPLLLEKTVYAGKTFATCNIAYRRVVFEQLGGFDEFFTEPSWEDNDLGLRAQWAGYRHLFNEKAIVYHPHEATLEEYQEKCRLNGRGAAVFSKKYLRKKPFWSFLTPFAMSRRLLFFFTPQYWSKKKPNEASVQCAWSWYSLQGYIRAMVGT